MRDYSEVEDEAAMRWKYWLCGGSVRREWDRSW